MGRPTDQTSATPRPGSPGVVGAVPASDETAPAPPPAQTANKARQDALIDESLEESFPASDSPTPKQIT